MQIKHLKAKHPSYDCQTWKLHSALYKGRIGCYTKEFLPKFHSETIAMYDNRLANAENVYENHIGHIIDQLEATVFSIPLSMREAFSRKVPDFYAAFKEDADTEGTDLVDFMRERFKEAILKGRSYWLVSPTMTNEPYLSALQAEDIYNWYADDNGLAWVIIHSSSISQPRIDQEPIAMDRFRVFKRDSIEIYEAPVDAKETEDAKLIFQAKNPLGYVPLLSLSMPDGLSPAYRASKLQIAHFEACHTLSYASKKTNFPIPVLKTEEEVRSVVNVGVGAALNIRPENSFEFVSPSSDSFETQMKRIESLRNEIYRVCGMSHLGIDNTTSTGAIARSGLSKVMDLSISDKSLEKYISLISEAIQRTFAMVSNQRGDDYMFDCSAANQGAFSRSISFDDMQTVLSLGIPSATFQAELKASAAQRLLPHLPQSAHTKIRQEIFMTIDGQTQSAIATSSIADRE